VHVITLSEVQNRLVVPEAASEARVMGTPQTLEEALTVVRAVKEAAGPRPVSAFSAADLVDRVRAGWGDLASVLTQLAGAGLTDFAELPVDALDDLEGVVRTARGAGVGAVRLTTAHAPGDRKADVLDRIRRCATDPGGLMRVNPLPRNMAVDRPTTGYEDVRMVALSRLVLNNTATAHPPFVEVDWALYGPKLAQVALTFGADFLDAVPATTDESLGRRRGTVEDVERNIRAAGFEPEEYRPSFDQGTGRDGQSRGTP
jgi:aminodeoxyfutalosine synthase